jgi:hypothetical protein
MSRTKFLKLPVINIKNLEEGDDVGLNNYFSRIP